MSRLHISFIGASIAMLLVACSKPEPEAVSKTKAAAEPVQKSVAKQSGGSDATVVDPDHYTTEFENDAVRILRIKYGPGEASAMHFHPDNVAVFLTDVTSRMTLPDGSTSDISVSAGDAGFASAGEHLPENISDSAQELVLVELKSRNSTTTGPSGPHATEVDPGHYTAEFENGSVCIVRIKYDAGEGSTMHYHPDSVAVFLTDHLVEMTLPDGSTEEISASAGQAMFIPAGQHLPKNVSDSPWEVVLIELK